MTKTKPLLLYAAMVSVSFLWGTSFAAAKVGMWQLAPLNLAMLRFLIASSVFGAILLAMPGRNTIETRDIPKFFLLGFLAITSYFYFQYTGLTYTTTINAALIMATSPICTAVFGTILGWERLSFFNILGIAVAFSGVSLIITNGNFSALFHSDTLIGDMLLMLNALVWAGVTVYGKRLMQKYSPFTAMAYIHIFGTLLLVPFMFFPGPFAPMPLTSQILTITWPTIVSSIYLALLCSVYCYYTYYHAVEKLGAFRTASFTYLNPLFAVLTAVLFLNEVFSLYIAVGGAMIITGVYITNQAVSLRQMAQVSR